MKRVWLVILALGISHHAWSQSEQKHDTVDLTKLENSVEVTRPWSAKKDNPAGGFFAGIGCGSFSHQLSGASGGILENASAENSTAFLLQAGYLFKGTSKSKLSVYESIGYSGLNTTGNAVSVLYRRTFHVTHHYMEWKTLPSYNINFDGGSFLALGLGFNMMVQVSGNSYIHNDNSAGGYDDYSHPKFKKLFACPVGEISFNGKKFSLSVHYQQSGNAVEYANESWSVHRIATSLNYRF